MQILDFDQVNKLTLEKQHLTTDTKIDNIVQIVEDICGLHSTELKTSYLSLFARDNKFKKSDLERELYEKKSMGRIRGMRRTLFIETLNWIPIVYTATNNLIEYSFEKYMEFHKVSLKEYQETSQNIIKIMKSRELSASEIRKELNSKSNIPAIIQVMCNRGLLIRGRPIKNWKDRRNKYALFNDYFPELNLNSYDENEAIKILVEKYIKAYGPVTETDIAWWLGLTKSKIKEVLKIIKQNLENVKISNVHKTYIMDKEELVNLENNSINEKPSLSLLPGLDPYPMGFKDRERYINTQNYNYLFDRSGNITSTIFLDGVAIGVWDVEDGHEPVMKFYLFHSIEKELLDELYSKIKGVGEFFFDKNVNI